MIDRRHSFQRPLLDGKIGLDIDVGGLDALVAQPQGDDGDIDSGLKQVHGTGVAAMSSET